MHVYSNVKN